MLKGNAYFAIFGGGYILRLFLAQCGCTIAVPFWLGAGVCDFDVFLA